MSKKKKIVPKGYTIEVVSWENDGDYYATKTIVVDTIEEAKAIKHMCDNLFKANHDGYTLGNTMDEDYKECYEIAGKYFTKNPFLVDMGNFDSEGDAWDSISHIHTELFGCSEYYFSRVCEKCEIYYSPEDIYLEIID